MKFFGKRQQQPEGLQENTLSAETKEQSEPIDRYKIGFEQGFMQGKLKGHKEGSVEGKEQGVKQGIEQERARMTQIFEQYTAVGHLIEADTGNKLLCDLITSGASPELAGNMIVSVLSNQQAGTMIQSSVGATSDGAVNPLVQNARQRAQGGTK